MHDDQKGFLEELQSLSDGTKKRVLIIATVLIMIIVIGVWVAYFNSIIGGTAASEAAQTTASTTAPAAAPVAPVPIAIVATTSSSAIATPSASGPGLWQNIKNGFSSFFRFFTGIFNRPSNYSIKPQGN